MRRLRALLAELMGGQCAPAHALLAARPRVAPLAHLRHSRTLPVLPALDPCRVRPSARPDCVDVRARYPYDAAVEAAREHSAELDSALVRCGVTTVCDAGGFAWTLERAREQRAPLVVPSGRFLAASEADSLRTAAGDRPDVCALRAAAAEAAVAASTAAGGILVSVVLPDCSPAAGPAEPRAAGSAESEPSASARALSTQLLDASAAAAERHGRALAVRTRTLEGARLAAASRASILLGGVEDDFVDTQLIEALRPGQGGALRGATTSPARPEPARGDGDGRGAAPAGPSAVRAGCAYSPCLASLDAREALFTRSVHADLEDLLELGATERARTLYELTASLPRNPRNRGSMRNRFLASIAARRHVGARNLLRLHTAGVHAVVGTGAGEPFVPHGPSFFAEAEAMQRAGLRALEVLKAATLSGCEALGLGATRGSLDAGKAADVLVLADDPSDDIGALRSVQLVIADGRVEWAAPGGRYAALRPPPPQAQASSAEPSSDGGAAATAPTARH